MPPDPFEFKKHPRLHPARLGFTLYARTMEFCSHLAFDHVVLDELDAEWAPVDDFNTMDTAVTARQMAALLHFLNETEELRGTVVVEIGSYHGVTTSKFAEATKRMVYAVDPFIGYGGAETDYEIFLSNTRTHPSIRHLRQTSGAAAKQWRSLSVSFLFVDAVHDYVNAMHDVAAWSAKLAPGGMLAMHDTDNNIFAGTRLAAWQIAKRMRIVCHIPDLLILQAP